MKNFKIKTRLRVGFTIVLVYAFVIGFIALNGLLNSNRRLNTFIDGVYAANEAVKSVRIEIGVAARQVRDMALEYDADRYEEHKEKINANIEAVENNIQVLKDCYDNEELVKELEDGMDSWVAVVNQVIAEVEEDGSVKATRTLTNKCVPTLDNIDSIVEKIDSDNKKILDGTLETSKFNSYASSGGIMILIGAMIVTSVIVVVFVTKSIMEPVKEIDRAAQDLAEGKLDTEITYTSKNEFGKLADSLRKSFHSLSLYIHEIGKMMDKMSLGEFDISTDVEFVGDFEKMKSSIMGFSNNISETLREINQSAEEINGGSRQVSIGAQHLSEGVTQQASSVQELSATISEINNHINNTNENVISAATLADDAEVEVNVGNEKMAEMIDSMNEISKKSTQIYDIIKTIDDIAFQTNILALNAAVEAARAGAAGKGFAVVADEVRNLAQKSSEAAKTTNDLIVDSISAVDKGVTIAHETADSLNVIVNKVDEIKTKIDVIKGASAEEANAAVQISAGIENISAVVQDNSATAEESAAASEQLNGQASVLKDMVSQFTLAQPAISIK